MYPTQKTKASRHTSTGSNPTSPCPVLHDPLKSLGRIPHTSRPIPNVGRPTTDMFCYFFPSHLQPSPSPSLHSVMLIGSISMSVNLRLNTVWTEVLAVSTCGAKSGTRVSRRSTRLFLNERSPDLRYHPNQTAMRISVAPGDISSRLPNQVMGSGRIYFLLMLLINNPLQLLCISVLRYPSQSTFWRSDGIRPCVSQNTSPPGPCRFWQLT